MSRPKVLLVDDRPDNLTALEAILSSLDLDLMRADSGHEALKALLSNDFAVILLDVLMPGMDGFETAAHIKGRERTKDIPIIFLTADASTPGSAFRGYAAGAVDYLAKPLDPWILRTKVSVFVDLHRKNHRLKEQAELLRTVLTEDAPSSSLLAEFAGRVAAIEDQVALLRAECPDDSGLAGHIDQLEDRAAGLRSALLAISAS